LVDRVECPRTQILSFLSGQVLADQEVRSDDAYDCVASTLKWCARSTAPNAARRRLRSAAVLLGRSRAISHAGSDFSARLRARNSLSTAL
jgi:hypothetical protein